MIDQDKGISKLIDACTGFPLAKNEAVVGTNALAHESGIHVAAVLEEPRTYELYSPEMVGAAKRIIIGKHTGSKALRYITQSIGYYLKDEELVDLSERVKMCSEFKHAKNCEELRKLILCQWRCKIVQLRRDKIVHLSKKVSV